MQEKNSFNPEISHLFSDNYEFFKEKVRNCCEKSFNERFNSENEQLDKNFYKLHFTPANQSSELILNKIIQQSRNSNKDTSISINEKVQHLKKWFLESYLEKLKENK